MKYWLFQNNQVVGPYDRDELAGTAGFGAESLVCPEGRKGTQMGDWQRAGVVAELAETLLRMARVPAGAGAGGGSFLPPEPTLRDLAVLGTLQEKVSLLENSLSSLHEELRAREEEISGLKVELSQKAGEASELQAKVGDLEVKLSAAESLRDDLARTREAQEGEARTIEDLRSQLDAVRAELQSSVGRMEETQERLREDLSGRIEKVKAAAKPAPEPVPAPSLETPALGIPEPIPFAAPEAPAPATPAALEPPALDAPLGLDAAPPMELGGATPAPVPLDAPGLELTPPGDAAPAFPPILDTPVPGAPPALDLPGPSPAGFPTPLPSPIAAPAPAPLFGPDTPAVAPAEAPVDLMAPEAKPKRGKKGLVAAVAVLAVGGGLAGAWQMGLLAPYLKQFGLAKAPPPAVEAPAPAPEPEPAPVDVAQGQPDRSQEAVELAKGYPIPRLNKTLAQVLEAAAPGAELVSPWTVKPGGEGRWEVSFYGKPGRLDYSYEVRLDPKELRGLNAKSQAVLDGKAPARPKPEAAPVASAAKARKGRHQGLGGGTSRDEPGVGRHAARPEGVGAAKAAAAALSEDPLGSLLLESSMPEEKPKAARRPRRARPAEEAAEEAATEDTAVEAAEEPAPAPKGRRKAAAKSADELTLDELLLPGVPKQ